MAFKSTVQEHGEVRTVHVEGALADEDVRALAEALMEPYKKGSSSVILNLEKVPTVPPAVAAYLYRLNDELDGRGADLVVARPQQDLPARPAGSAFRCRLRVEPNRHLALGALLDQARNKSDLLGFLRRASAIGYTVAAREGSPTYAATFVRNLQNFLVIDPGADCDKDLRKGVRLRFELDVAEEDSPGKVVTFDAEVYKFAILKDRPAPCLVVKVPELLNVTERRRDPRLTVALRLRFWGASGDRTPREGQAVNLSSSGIQFKAARCDSRENDELFVDVDFPNFKFSQPCRSRIVRLDYDDSGGRLVACEFQHLSGRDQQVLDDFILNYC